MFTVWNVPERRTTLDIDFLAHFENTVKGIEGVVKEACKAYIVDDGLSFDPATVKGRKIKEDADYAGVRIKFTGFLERSRIPMQLDFGFGDAVHPEPSIVEYPCLLDFPKPRINGYPVESVISEKFEAIVKLGLLNSRMKDFYDIWLIMRHFDFNGARLVEALKKTFKHRKTDIPAGKHIFAEEIYDVKSDRQALWKTFIEKNDAKHAPEKLADIAGEIEKFLFVPLAAAIEDRKLKARWTAPGPWK